MRSVKASAQITFDFQKVIGLNVGKKLVDQDEYEIVKLY